MNCKNAIFALRQPIACYKNSTIKTFCNVYYKANLFFLSNITFYCPKKLQTKFVQNFLFLWKILKFFLALNTPSEHEEELKDETVHLFWLYAFTIFPFTDFPYLNLRANCSRNIWNVTWVLFT